MTIFALHGFLGSGADWDQLKSQSKRPQNSNWVTPSLFDGSIDLRFLQSFDSIVNFLRHSFLETIKTRETEMRSFVGYSLGGRIGLHWLEKFPDDFERWIFLSTHPGLGSETDRSERLKSDHKWRVALNSLDRLEFLKEWNSQEVFKKSQTPQISNQIWSREYLETALDQLSLARQKDFSALLQTAQNKITWAVGRQDTKFLQIGEKLKKDVKFNFHILDSGHRIYLDQPNEILKILGI
jgi:2-succinyl-6-hydroxy-2,4-cyclohexadiene-1-carboxylate synthase